MTWLWVSWKPALGLNGVVWLTAVVIAAVFAWTFRLLIVRRANMLVALVLVLLALSASMIHFLARPARAELAVYAGMVLGCWILPSGMLSTGEAGKGARWLWALPLLMLVWVNVHGGFLVGFVLLGIFLLGAVWGWFRAREDRIEEAPAKDCGREASAESGVELGCFRRRRAW